MSGDDDPVRAVWPGNGLISKPDGAFELPAGEPLCNAKGILFGGWMLGTVVHVGQAVTGKRLRELSASYLAPVPQGATVEFVPQVLSSGRSLSQLRCDAMVDRSLVATALGVFGSPPSESRLSEERLTMPDVPPPDACPERAFATGRGTGSTALMRTRVAFEALSKTGIPLALQWVSLEVDVRPEVLVAVVSDHVPSLVRRSFADLDFIPTVTAGLQLRAVTASRWLLLDVTLSAADGVLATGVVNIWSEDGHLVATACQTCRLMTRRP